MKKTNRKETLKIWLGALLLLAESAAIGCKKLPKKAVALCVAAALIVAMVPSYVFAVETTYDLRVGGVQFTSDNLVIDSTDNSAITSGLATYAPDTKTLTLDNFSCSSDAFGGVIHVNSGDITIKLKGNNTLTGTGEYTSGISTNGNLAICNGEDGVAQGQLTINTETSCINVPLGTLNITGVKVTATSTENNGLYAAESISLNGITLSATANWMPIYTDEIWSDWDPESNEPPQLLGHGAINIENSTVEAYCADTVWGYNVFDSAPNISGTFAVYAGADAATAEKVDVPTDDTYTTNKYIKIASVSHTHCICGETHAVIGEHQQADEKAFLPVSTEAQLQEVATNGGSVYLVNDIEITNGIVTANGSTLNLCLNGKRIYKGGTQSIDLIKVGQDGTLNLTDCGATGEISGSSKNGIYVGRRAALNMFGGNITDNSGGGIETYLYAVIRMFGGKITNNHTGGDGGGINMDSGDIYIYDGEISGNVAEHGGGIDGSARIFLYGGKITGNTATDGGGIYTSGGVRAEGAPQVTGNHNKNGDDDNIYVINDNHCVQLDGPLTQGAAIAMKRWNGYGAAAAPSIHWNEEEGIDSCMQYLTSDDDLPMYMKGDSIYLGYTITKQPDTTDYRVEVNKETGVTYQWYRVEKEATLVTKDDVDAIDPGYYKGNFDSTTNKWSAHDAGSAYGYLMVELAAGEQLVVEFDAPVPGDVMLTDYNVFIEGEKNGNTYTFTAPEDSWYALWAYDNAAEPVAIAAHSTTATWPDVMAKKVSYTNEEALQGQTAAALNTAGLANGYYFCEASWSAQGQSDRSAVVEYHVCAYTYTASGNVITEKCDCGHEETATVNAPAQGSEKAAVTYSDGWKGGNISVSYAAGNNEDTVASITIGGVTASVTFTNAPAETPDETEPSTPAETPDETEPSTPAETPDETEPSTPDTTMPKSPKTGDSFHAGLWICVMSVSAMALAVLLIGKKKGIF